MKRETLDDCGEVGCQGGRCDGCAATWALLYYLARLGDFAEATAFGRHGWLRWYRGIAAASGIVGGGIVGQYVRRLVTRQVTRFFFFFWGGGARPTPGPRGGPQWLCLVASPSPIRAAGPPREYHIYLYSRTGAVAHV